MDVDALNGNPAGLPIFQVCQSLVLIHPKLGGHPRASGKSKVGVDAEPHFIGGAALCGHCFQKLQLVQTVCDDDGLAQGPFQILPGFSRGGIIDLGRRHSRCCGQFHFPGAGSVCSHPLAGNGLHQGRKRVGLQGIQKAKTGKMLLQVIQLGQDGIPVVHIDAGILLANIPQFFSLFHNPKWFHKNFPSFSISLKKQVRFSLQPATIKEIPPALGLRF